ncbi:Exportin-5, partial [Physocladia obscura]
MAAWKKVLAGDDYDYLKRLAELVGIFAEKQMFYKQMTHTPNGFERLLELLMFFTQHESRTIASYVASTWHNLSTHEVMKNIPQIQPFLGRLLNVCIQRILEGDSKFISETSKEYDEVDFDDEGDCKACIESNAQRFSTILQFVAKKQPFETFTVVDEHVRFLVFSVHQNVERNDFGFLVPGTQVAAHLENIQSVFDIVIKAIPNVLDPEFSDKGLLAKVSTFFTDFLNFHTQDPVVLRCVLSVLVCVTESVCDEASLLKCIEKIFTAVTFTMPDETDFSQRRLILREDTRNLRMKAASALVKLAASLPDALIPLFDKFVPLIRSYVQTNVILHFERVKLVEFLIVMIHGCTTRDFDTKSQMFGLIVSSNVAEWEMLDDSPFSRGEALLSALGIRKLASGDTLSELDVQVVEQWRHKINLELRSWMMWMKRTPSNKNQPSLWSPYLARIVPKILSMIR